MNPKSFEKLNERKENGNFRKLFIHENKIDFFSNDYLGISKDLAQINLSQQGSTGSRLISGNSFEAEDMESYLANFFQSEASLLFNSGYDANLGLFSSMARRQDIILYDEYIHASVRDGIQLSQSKSFSFKHNDLEDLKKKVQSFRLNFPDSDIFVAVESLYSMDGDFAPLEKIATFCENHHIYLIVDEAHSGGLFGEKGRGLCSSLNIVNSVFARLITFGKAYGSHGAVVLGSHQLKEFLINFARSFIYTTALPPHQYELIKFALDFSFDEDRRENLQKNIALFRELNSKFIRFSDEKSPIQSLIFDEVEKIRKMEERMLVNEFAVKAIFSPTVSKGKERIRVCLHSFNTDEEIIRFSKCFQE